LRGANSFPTMSQIVEPIAQATNIGPDNLRAELLGLLA
jgi:hypothetical protein